MKRMLNQGQKQVVPVHRIGAIVMGILVLQMVVAMIWREVIQLDPSRLSDWRVSGELLFLSPIFISLAIVLVVLWQSRTTDWMVQKSSLNGFIVMGMLAVVAGGLYGIWQSDEESLVIWSPPSLLAFSLFMWVCLLAFQLESVASGKRRWGFSVAGFDYRDLFNLSLLGVLFFGLSHLIVSYDPIASNFPQLPVWLLPLFAICTATGLSCLSAKILRFPMAASIAGFLMLGIRNAIFTGLATEPLGSSVVPVILGPVFVLDLLLWFKSGRASPLLIAGIASVALFLNYPIFDEWLGLSFSGNEYVLLILIGFGMSLATAWVIQKVQTADLDECEVQKNAAG